MNIGEYDILESKGYLLSLRDNLDTTFSFNEKSIELAKSAINQVQELVNNELTSEKADKTMVNQIMEWTKHGEKLFLSSLEEIKNGISNSKNISISK